MDDGAVERQTYTLPELFRILGISRPVGYELAKNDQLPVPVIRIGEYRSVVSRRAVEELLNQPPTQRPSEPSGRDDTPPYDMEAIENALLKLSTVGLYLIEQFASLAHQVDSDDDKAEDMVDVLQELRADVHALRIARRRRNAKEGAAT